MGQTIAEKILAQHSNQKQVYPNDIITAKIDVAFSHDNTGMVIDRFHALNAQNIWNTQKLVIALDHRSPANTIAVANSQQKIRDFIKKHNLVVWRFHDHWHRHKPDGIYTGMIKTLGFSGFSVSEEDKPIFQIPETTAYQLALEIHRISVGFPQIEQYELAGQLRRSSRSIAANIAEGMGKQESKADVRRFIRMAVGSCDESRVWLEFARDLGYLEAEQQGGLDARYREVGRMLRGILKRYGQ